MVNIPFEDHPVASANGASAVKVVVLTGLSGAGKTIALRALEDFDFYCVDNLPAGLMPALVEAVSRGGHRRIGVGVDVRNRSEDLGQLPQVLAGLASSGIDYELIFLDSRDDVLSKRFSDTRRRHPLSADGLPLHDAIALERKLLRPLAAIADRVIDSSELNVHQLRRLVTTELGITENELTLLFESFAYRRGLPRDADFVFDARVLPNPHWDAVLRPLSGKDQAVRDWLQGQPEVVRFLEQLTGFLDEWLPRFEADNRSYVTICIGCSGGRHRSVFLAERLADHFRGSREQVLTFHRELE